MQFKKLVNFLEIQSQISVAKSFFLHLCRGDNMKQKTEMEKVDNQVLFIKTSFSEQKTGNKNQTSN